MVAKSLQMPVFDISKYGGGIGSVHVEAMQFADIFNEIVYKMAHYYFSVF
jgi:hypothetical protein